MRLETAQSLLMAFRSGGDDLLSTPRMFKFAFIILTVGVSLFLSRKFSDTSKLKSIEDYWAESGLGPAALEDLLQDEKCQSSERYFLACVNSVLSVSSRFNLSLNPSGKLVAPADALTQDFTSEKTQLEPWKNYYLLKQKKAPLSFLGAWQEMKSRMIEPAQAAMMTGLGLNGFISVFRDPHTYFIPVAQFKEVISKTDSRSNSLGLNLGFHHGHYAVRKVLDGTSAKAEGVQRGDILESLNGQAVDGLMPARISELLKGKENQTAYLVVNRAGEKIKFKLTHKEVTVPTVSVKVVDGIKPVAVLGVNKFSKGTCEKVKEALGIIKKAQVRGLLLDLRDNPGGQMEEASCVASLFVGPHKKIFEVRYLDPNQKPEQFFGNQQKYFSLPVAVLINGYSASAAEIVAGSLRDLNRAVLVGERTFGKGSFQEGEYWSQNKNIALFETKGLYYLPSGVTPQMRGIEPDVEVKFDDLQVYREADQFMNPLRVGANQELMVAKAGSTKKCLEIDDGQKVEDIQIAKAREVLFCNDFVARAGL